MLSENIHAFVRLRPKLEDEKSDRAVLMDNDTTVHLPKSNETFSFGSARVYLERVFG